MTSNQSKHTGTAHRAPTPPPPRWAVRAAHLIPLTVLPSGLWRLALACGYPGGYTRQGFDQLHVHGRGLVYVVALSVLSEGLALLALGLVRPWGEVPPRWVPFMGGRPLRPRAVVGTAAAGAVLLTLFWAPLLWWWAIPHPDMTPAGRTVVGFLYLPLVAWGPLLAAVTASYHRRHRRTPAPAGSASASTPLPVASLDAHHPSRP
ncbi:hypothetical protein MUU72_26140 [Streptomyces sp. RS10V-4]|uniref:hypothetical protein n=1 Tax=Streptomyces rhizoryzae TaxID=2932493 RepID=UPI0020043C29|nr:hypothetical protein [Streptomyces rhizoryzae]MCK7626539.1 hypothetical protein [Streptomyces rhizoryzae]